MFQYFSLLSVFEDATLMRDDELREEVSTQNQDFILKFNEEVQEISSCSTPTFTVQDDSGKPCLCFFFPRSP